MEICIHEAAPYIEQTLKAGLVPFLHGSPGIGKSATLKNIADKFNLEMIDLRLSQCEPTDLMGFPSLTGDKASYKPMNFFPVEGDPVPSGKAGWLLNLDEMNGADEAVQKASYKLVLDRMVGDKKLHKNVAIVAAGNLSTDRALVEDMSTALQSRMVHFTMTVKPENWLQWAGENGIDYRIKGFLDFRPELLCGDLDHEDKTFPCPRTWHMLSKLINGVSDQGMLGILSDATVGEGAGLEFTGFAGIYQDLPRYEDVVKAPMTAKVPEELSSIFAMASMLGARATESALDNIVTYAKRMHVEAQVILLRNIVSYHKEYLKAAPIKTWCRENTSLVAGL